MDKKLKDYMDEKVDYQPDINILLNWNVKAYEVLSEYILDKIKPGDLPKDLKLHLEFRNKRGVGIWFLCATLDHDMLIKMFGQGVLHNEFGEGFPSDNDPYKGEWSCITFFENINGTEFMIVHDHRGTSFSAKEGTTGEEILNAYKALVDKYIEINKA